MSASDALVIAAGIGAIAWVNWYFFLAERKAVQAVSRDGGVQEVAITVKGGYDPATVRVRRGQLVRLVFDRQETFGCSEEVVVGEFGIRKFLPAFQRTAVEFTPRKTGTYDFSCGMGMLHGKLIVE